MLPSPRRRRPGRTSPRRRVSGPFRLSLIGTPYLSGRGGRTGRRGTFTGQCCQPLCAGDPASHPAGPRAVTEFRRERIPFRGFRRSRSLAFQRDRNAMPPAPSSPGPSVAACCQTTLARSSRKRVRVRISGPARTRPGRIRLHQDSSHENRTVYRLSRQHLRLTRLPTPSRLPTCSTRKRPVIPAQAGIQGARQIVNTFVDSRLRGNDVRP
jgi:hypothetical protein